MNALVKYDIAFESHIYAFGPHGYSTGDPSIQELGSGFCDRLPNWVEDSIGWLGDVFGVNGPAGMTEPRCPWHLTGDYEDFLSIDCTYQHLMKQEQAAKILEQLVQEVEKECSEDEEYMELNGSMNQEQFDQMVSKMKLRDIMAYFQVPDSMREDVNRQLSLIPNVH